MAITRPNTAKTKRLEDELAKQKFFASIEITPEDPVVYLSRTEQVLGLVKVSGRNLGVAIRVYDEGTRNESCDLAYGNWRTLQKRGMTVLMNAQRQEEMIKFPLAAPLGCKSMVTYYGLPAYISSKNPDV
ncbi:TPA: hypothetical protein HA251_03305 [Candidatus Woesearchaeota archaeon]|nr:hypothetical protein [Candidatus Woesearchaeota archaeon]